jgi:hypothetical protein
MVLIAWKQPIFLGIDVRKRLKVRNFSQILYISKTISIKPCRQAASPIYNLPQAQLKTPKPQCCTTKPDHKSTSAVGATKNRPNLNVVAPSMTPKSTPTAGATKKHQKLQCCSAKRDPQINNLPEAQPKNNQTTRLQLSRRFFLPKPPKNLHYEQMWIIFASGLMKHVREVL